MNFSINSKYFLAQLANASKLILPKHSTAILTTFHIELKGGVLYVTGSDGENTLVCKSEVITQVQEGKCCVDSKRILDMLKTIPACALSVKVQNGVMTLVHPSGKMSLSVSDPTLYPFNSEGEQSVLCQFSVPSATVLEALDNVDFAVSTEEFRQILNGVYWDIQPDSITFVATDTRQLARYRKTASVNSPSPFVLPNRVIPIIKARAPKEANFNVSVYARSVCFSTPEWELSAVLVNGKYPDYNRVIPKDSPKSLVIDRVYFLDAINRISTCTGETGLVKFHIHSGNALSLHALNDALLLTAEEHLDCETTELDLTIGFNANYLKNILSAIRSNKVEMKLIDATRPAVFYPVQETNEAQDGLTALLMPSTIK